jgi:PAS domain S-box-containing protein
MAREQVVGHLVSECLDATIFEQLVKPRLEECFEGAAVQYELKYTYPKLGERDLLISYFPIEGLTGIDRAACILRDVTGTKRAEKALGEAEQKYRDIFENAGEGIFQSTPDGRYLVVNPALARMHGFGSPEELIHTLTDISRDVYVDPQRRKEFKDVLEKQGYLRGFEHQIFRRDGTRIWISVNARAVRNSLGEVLYYEGTVQDINQRRSAEARSTAFGTLARRLSGASTRLEIGRIIAETAQELFGWDSCNLDMYDADRDLVRPMLNVDTIDGRPVDITAFCVDRKPTARARRVIEDGSQLLLREDPIQFDKDAIPFGDTLRPSASIMTVPVRHAAKVIALLSIQSYQRRAYDSAALNDLQTLADYCGEALNRIKAEESLYESEERFRQLAEHFEDVVWLTDQHIQKVLYINPAYERVFRRTCESVYENLESTFDVIHPEDRAELERSLERQRNGEHEQAELRIIWPDGSVRWILRRSFPIRNTEGEIHLIAGIAQDITERKRAQEERRESEERYRDLVENSREFICTHDLDGVILSANRAAVEVLGYDPKDFAGRKNFRELLVPEVRDQFADYLERIRRDGFASGLTLVQTQTGERRILEYHNSLRTEGVAAPIVRGMAHDITERKRHEESLKLFRNLIDQSTDAIEVIDQATLRFIDCNESAHQSLGYSREEFLALTIFDIDPQIDRARLAQFDEEIKASGFATLESVHRRKDGTTFPVEVNVKLITLGKVYRLAVVRDTTTRKLAEQALRESEERYRELFDNARDAIYVHDLGGRYISLNLAAEKLIGFSRDQIIGKHFSNFISPADLKHVRKNLCRKLDVEGETTYEINLVTKDRRRVPVEVRSRLIYENGQPIGVQGTARDITERRRAQEALQVYSRRLIEAQEAERQILARELHDEIGQVLTAVRINLQTVQGSCRDADSLPRVHDSIVIVDEALGRIRDISLELRPSLLDDLGLASALRWYVDRYGQRTGIVAEVLCAFEDRGRVPRDLETECFRIAQEALTNVARHARASHVVVQLEDDPEKLLLTIGDNGIGFDSETLLQTASSASTLGLRGMMERALAMHGQIRIDSSPGNGTQIRASFPLKR